MDISYDTIVISKYVFFKEAWGSQFYCHHQDCNYADYIKRTFKNSMKVTKITNYV